MKILIATRNPAKFFDLKDSLTDLPFDFKSLKDLNIKGHASENYPTFEENAKSKALFYLKASKIPTIADDGGIEIDALNKEPGVKTRRWIDNKESSDNSLIKYTLIRMRDVASPERGAQLRAIICLAYGNKTYSVEGIMRGIIAEKPYHLVKTGFPFDSLMYFPDKQKYYYQIKYEIKNPVNHRTIACQKLKPILKSLLEAV